MALGDALFGEMANVLQAVAVYQDIRQANAAVQAANGVAIEWRDHAVKLKLHLDNLAVAFKAGVAREKILEERIEVLSGVLASNETLVLLLEASLRAASSEKYAVTILLGPLLENFRRTASPECHAFFREQIDGGKMEVLLKKARQSFVDSGRICTDEKEDSFHRSMLKKHIRSTAQART